MSRITDSIQAANSAVRTLMALVVVGALGTLGWFGYASYVEPGRQLDEARRLLDERQEKINYLARSVEEQKREIVRLETSLQLLKVDHRIAELHVVDQRENPQTGRVQSTVQFVEINDEGAPIDGPKEYVIDGDIVYIEAKVVQFQDQLVEEADPDRSTSLCLFQRIFGEYQEPHEGFPIDEVGSRPTAYARGGEISEFEKGIWQDFWDIANDRARADELGVRAIHIEAPGMKVRLGRTYRITLRASGGLSILPAQQNAPVQNVRPDA